MGRRHLTAGEMLVGQTLALLYLDPGTVQSNGVTTQDVVVSRLAGLIGHDELICALNPRRRKSTERTAQQTVRDEIAKSLRGLAQLGFVEPLADGRLRMRLSVLRFADPVRGLADPAQAMARLVSDGEAVTDGPPEIQDDDTSVDQYTSEMAAP